MKSAKEKFDEILKTDEFGLLDVTLPKSTPHKLNTLERDFESILEFYNRTGKVPSKNGSFLEKRLAYRLEVLQKNSSARNKLQAMDAPGLLLHRKDEVLGIDDPMGLLTPDKETEAITTFHHVKSNGHIDPDYIARRNRCLGFSEKYQPSFEAVSEEIADGTRILTPFQPQDLEAGRFFVLQGMLLFLERDCSSVRSFGTETGSNMRRRDGRTRCIFINGTESDLLYRSLSKALSKDGYTVSAPLPGAHTNVTITSDDKVSGYIYVLKSRSKVPAIRAIPDLYKIGFSSGEVSERVKNAANEPTYLMSDVIIVEQAKCYNVSIRGLEDTIHKIFGAANVNLTISDRDGIQHHPKEWFSVPLRVIEQAIHLIIAGKAEDIRYDPDLKTLIHRK